MEKQTRAYLYATAVVLFWSTVAAAIKKSLNHLDSFNLVFYASIVSTSIFFIHLLSTKNMNALKTFTKKDYLQSAMLGFLNPCLYYIVLFKAYSILPAQEAQPINFIWPITLVLLSIPLLRQKIKLRDIIAVIISFLGVLIISTHGDILRLKFTSLRGVLLALGSTVIWALFWIYNAKDKHNEAARLFVNFTFGSVFIFISTLLFSKPECPSFKGLLGAVYVGLFEMGITFLLWLKALKLSKTTAHIANLIYLAPFLSLILIYFIVGETILLSSVVGLIFIIGGIILQKLRN